MADVSRPVERLPDLVRPDQVVLWSQNLNRVLTRILSTKETFGRSFYHEACSNKTIALDSKAVAGYTITALQGIKTSSGTITAAVQINGTNVTGLSAIAVTSSAQDATATGSNVVDVGDRVTLVLSSNASAVDLEFTLSAVKLLPR